VLPKILRSIWLTATPQHWSNFFTRFATPFSISTTYGDKSLSPWECNCILLDTAAIPGLYIHIAATRVYNKSTSGAMKRSACPHESPPKLGDVAVNFPPWTGLESFLLISGLASNDQLLLIVPSSLRSFCHDLP
jgi:hypothetical protein